MRKARFNAALITSTVFNASRSAESEPLEVWDFIPGFERDVDEIEHEKSRRAIRHGVVVAFSNMHGKTVEQVRDAAKSMIQNLRANGTEDADELVRGVFEEVIKVPLE